MNFENLVKEKKFKTVEEAIAHEFGYFIENTSKLTIINGDEKLIKTQLGRTTAKKEEVTIKDLTYYKILEDHTEFEINGKKYSISAVLPRELSCSIEMAELLNKYLNITTDPSFSKLKLPPGRNSLFKGLKGITILDSSYNNSLHSAKMMIKVLSDYPKTPKWAVLGDILEQGSYEKEEHEKLSDIILAEKALDKIILVGPRTVKHTYPGLKSLGIRVEKFILPKDALDYILDNITGKEVILFKGTRFLEGIIECLLIDKKDINKLCRREKIWKKRRKQWGL